MKKFITILTLGALLNSSLNVSAQDFDKPTISVSHTKGAKYRIEGLNTQDSSKRTTFQTYYWQNYLGIGVLGSIKYPGLELNYSKAHKSFIQGKKGKEKFKIRRWEFFTRYYYHRNFHHNIMLTAGKSWQRKLKKERFFISQADIGLSRTFYDRPTFRNNNGRVERMWLAGDFYFNFNYRFGFGKHFHHKQKTYRLYSYFGLLNFFPYNNLYYSRVYLGLNLNKFIHK